ncbi:MAG: hypothetical protein ACP5D7_17415 [Limnospira sp.]
MNTPSHAIINLALLAGSGRPEANLLIVFGAILPDIPIFIFYGWAKWIAKMSERQIWSEAYYSPPVQTIVATCHSLPIAALGWAIAFQLGWQIPQLLCLSLILHSLFDLPVHNDDAHRHFFPLSNYRFISPVSYWNPRQYGAIVAFLEILLVLFATVSVWCQVRSPVGQGFMVLVNGFYCLGYSYQIFRRMQRRSRMTRA